MKTKLCFSSSLSFIMCHALVLLCACQTAIKTEQLVLSESQPLPLQLKEILADKIDDAKPTEKINLPENQYGYVLYDPENKKIIDSKNSDQLFIPASSIKILTALAGLKILGPNYKFKTTLSYQGKIKDHTLNGDLYLKGYGDPVLKISHLMNLALTLKNKKIKKIKGYLFYDESEFISSSQINLVREPWASYNSGISALSSEFNQFKIELKNRTDSEVQEFKVLPRFDFQNFQLSSTSRLGEDPFLFQSLDINTNQESWTISPYITKGIKKNLPHHQPARATAELFIQLCQLQGIEFDHIDARSKKQPKKVNLIHLHRSSSLISIVDSLLEYSNNSVAELVMMTAAKKQLGHSVSILSAAKYLENWIKKEIPQLNESSFSIDNGSGLSSKNLISPLQWIAILEYADRWSFDGKKFETLLPISGWKGTFFNHWNQSSSAFRIWAKTGTLYYAKALVGYLYTYKGKKMYFSFLTNDLKSRALLDQTLLPLTDQQNAQVNSWGKKAAQARDQIIMEWLKK